MSNTLEKLSHQYHMQEIYSRASFLYKEMVKDSSLDNEFCSCANDIVNNGVLAELAGVAKTLKYRARTGRKRACGENNYGSTYNSASTYNNRPVPSCVLSTVRGPTLVTARPVFSRGRRSADEDVERLEQEYLDNTTRDTAMDLLQVKGWRPNTTTGPQEWVIYSAMLYTSLPTDQELADFATFIYCKLNQPEALPTDLF